MQNGRLIDDTKVVLAGGPVLLNTAGIAADYFSMKNYKRCMVIIALTPASGTDVSAVTLKQAKTVDNSPATEKALSFTKVFKNGAPDTSDRLVETAVTNDTFNTSAVAAKELYVIEVMDTDLDVANDFDCFRVNMTDPGSVSTPAVVTYIGYEARNPADVSRAPSAIID